MLAIKYIREKLRYGSFLLTELKAQGERYLLVKTLDKKVENVVCAKSKTAFEACQN